MTSPSLSLSFSHTQQKRERERESINMKSAAARYNQNNFFKKERFHSLANIASLLFYLACLTIAILVGSHLLYNTTTIKYTTNVDDDPNPVQGTLIFLHYYIPDSFSFKSIFRSC